MLPRSRRKCMSVKGVVIATLTLCLTYLIHTIDVFMYDWPSFTTAPLRGNCSLCPTEVARLKHVPLSARVEAVPSPRKPSGNFAKGETTSGTQTSDLGSHQRVSSSSTLLLVWCGRRTFRFEHFLSVKSALLALKPRAVFVACDTERPLHDSYNTWFQQLQQDLALFRVFVGDESDVVMCLNDHEPNLPWIKHHLKSLRGGIYLNLEKMLSPGFINLLNGNKYFTAVDQSHSVVAVVLPHELAVDQQVSRTLAQKRNISVLCSELYSAPAQLVCSQLPTKLYPEDIWTCAGAACEVARLSVYARAEPVVPAQGTGYSPNIVHYIWYGMKSRMSLSFFLSILSFVYIQDVDSVYIHGDHSPHGPLWNQLQRQEFIKSKVKLVYRVKPVVVFNQTIKVVEHIADITKADISFRYGGIIADTDLLLFRKLDAIFSEFGFVVGFDIGKYGEFPDVFNVGITVSQQGNSFAKGWLESAKNFNDSDWLYNAAMATYKLYEKHPEWVYVRSDLQVMCYKYKLYSTWHVDKFKYQNLRKNPGIEFSITKQTQPVPYTFHFTWPEPFVTMKYLAGQGGIVGDLGRLILAKANLTHLLTTDL